MRWRSTVPGSAGWTDIPDGRDAGTNTADETRFTISNLSNGTQYAFELRAVNVAGEGAKTGSITATPGVAACGAPDFSGRTQIWTGNLTVGAAHGFRQRGRRARPFRIGRWS